MSAHSDAPFPHADPAPAGPATPDEIDRRSSTPEWVERPSTRSDWFVIGPTAPGGSAEPDQSEWLDMRLVVLGIATLVLAVLSLVAGSVLGAAVFVLVAIVLLVTAFLLERAMKRDPWRRPPGHGAVPSAPPALRARRPAADDGHRHLPVGPGRAGAEAAEALLERSEGAERD